MASTPVSLPLQSTLPAPGTTVLPPSLATSLPPHLTSSPHSSGNNTTRILLLSEFSPELKTRDIQLLFAEFEDDRGGFKIKWNDDVSCWIVFDNAAVAKRAFVAHLANSLLPTDGAKPKLVPYNGPDVAQILTAVQNRPRSRSINGHSRKNSALGSGSSVGYGGGGDYSSASMGQGHARSRSTGTRGSFGQKQMKEMMEEHPSDIAPPVPAIPDHLAQSSLHDESALSSSPP